MLEYRVTEVLTREAGEWLVVASHWSAGVPEEEALEAAAAGRWPALAPIPDIVDPGADELANQISRDLRDPSALAASIDDAPFVLIGPGVDDYLLGADAARTYWRGKVERLEASFSREGKNRVALMPGGDLAWAITNLDLHARTDDGVVTLPLRALLVYELRFGRWRLVHAHVAHGLAEPPELPEPRRSR